MKKENQILYDELMKKQIKKYTSVQKKQQYH